MKRFICITIAVIVLLSSAAVPASASSVPYLQVFNMYAQAFFDYTAAYINSLADENEDLNALREYAHERRSFNFFQDLSSSSDSPILLVDGVCIVNDSYSFFSIEKSIAQGLVKIMNSDFIRSLMNGDEFAPMPYTTYKEMYDFIMDEAISLVHTSSGGGVHGGGGRHRDDEGNVVVEVAGERTLQIGEFIFPMYTQESAATLFKGLEVYNEGRSILHPYIIVNGEVYFAYFTRPSMVGHHHFHGFYSYSSFGNSYVYSSGFGGGFDYRTPSFDFSDLIYTLRIDQGIYENVTHFFDYTGTVSGAHYITNYFLDKNGDRIYLSDIEGAPDIPYYYFLRLTSAEIATLNNTYFGGDEKTTAELGKYIYDMATSGTTAIAGDAVAFPLPPTPTETAINNAITNNLVTVNPTVTFEGDTVTVDNKTLDEILELLKDLENGGEEVDTSGIIGAILAVVAALDEHCQHIIEAVEAQTAEVSGFFTSLGETITEAISSISIEIINENNFIENITNNFFEEINTITDYYFGFDENYFTAKQAELERELNSKLGFVDKIQQMTDKVVNTIEDNKYKEPEEEPIEVGPQPFGLIEIVNSKAPVYEIDVYGATIPLIDFSFFDEYRSRIHNIMTAILSVFFILSLPNRLIGLITGLGGFVSNYANSHAKLDPDTNNNGKGYIRSDGYF